MAMIVANELRLGNWLLPEHNLDGEYYRVEEIGIGSINNRIESWYSPIPLTPEILEKCGFVLSYDDTFKNEKYFKKDGFDDLADYGGQSIVLTDKGNYLECGYYDNQITCESIHQLQNLYFALTGEELKVQL